MGRSAWFRVLLGLTMVWALNACDSGDDAGATPEATGLTCGAGTIDSGGVCMPEDVTSMVCGEGTIADGTECVPDDGTGPGGLTCGSGTVEVNGACEIDPDGQTTPLICGEGTIEVEGECVLDFVEAPMASVSELNFVGLEVDAPTSAPGTIKFYAPIHLEVTIEATANMPFVSRAMFGLVTVDGEHMCFLESISFSHHGDGAPVTIGGSFIVPAECLPESALADGSIVMTPFVVIDPEEELDFGSEEADMVASAAKFDAEAAAEAPDLFALCSSGSTDDGSCIFEFSLFESDGIDFALQSIDPQSSVVIVGDQSAGVMINMAGEMVYGPAEITLDATIVAFGAAALDEELEMVNVLESSDLELTYTLRPKNSTDAWKPLFLHTPGDPAKAGEEGGVESYEGSIEETMALGTPHVVNRGLYIEDHCGTPCGDTKCTHNDTCTPGGYCVLDPALGDDPGAGGCDASKNARYQIIYGDWRTEEDFEVRVCLSSAAETSPEALTNTDLSNCATTEIKLIRVDPPEDKPDLADLNEAEASTWSKGHTWEKHPGKTKDIGLKGQAKSYAYADYAGARWENLALAQITTKSSSYPAFDLFRAWADVGAYTTVINTGIDAGLRLINWDALSYQKKMDDSGKTCTNDSQCKSKDCVLNGSKKTCAPGILWSNPIAKFEYSHEIEWNSVAFGIPYFITFEYALELGVNREFSITAAEGGSDSDSTWPIAVPGNESAGSIWGQDDGYWDDAQAVGAIFAGWKPYAESSLTLEVGIGNTYIPVKVGVGGKLYLLQLEVPTGARLAWGAVNPNASGEYQGIKVRLDVGAYLTNTLLNGSVYFFIETKTDYCYKWKKMSWWPYKSYKSWSLCWETVYSKTLATYSGFPASFKLYSVTDCDVYDGQDSCTKHEWCWGNCTSASGGGGSEPEPSGCTGNCGKANYTEGCYCDSLCLKYGDCCANKIEVCGGGL